MADEYINPHLLESWPKVIVENLDKEDVEDLNGINEFNVGRQMEIVAVNRSTGEVYFRWL